MNNDNIGFRTPPTSMCNSKIDNKIKKVYIKRYPLSNIAKKGISPGMSNVHFLRDYETEVISVLMSRLGEGDKRSVRIIASGTVLPNREDMPNFNLLESDMVLYYITYSLTNSTGDKRELTKKFYMQNVDSGSSFRVRGVRNIISPVISSAIMARKPDGAMLTRFRREKQISEALLDKTLLVNGKVKHIRWAYYKKPFKLIDLSTKPGFMSKIKSAHILMTIFNKGLEHVLNKYYKVGLDDFVVRETTELVSKDENKCVVVKTNRKNLEHDVCIETLNRKDLLQLAAALFHIIDNWGSLQRMIVNGEVDWSARSVWNMLIVGKSIFHDTCSSDDLYFKVTTQEEFISSYMVKSVVMEFDRMGYKFEDIYDYYAIIFTQYDKLTTSEEQTHKRVESLYYLYSNSINNINKELQHAMNDLLGSGEKSLDRASRRIMLTSSKNANLSARSLKALCILPYTSVGDCKVITVGTQGSIQEVANGNDKLESQSYNSGSVVGKDVNATHLLFGNSFYLSSSNTNPMMTHNVYNILEDGLPTSNPELLKKLDMELGPLTSED